MDIWRDFEKISLSTEDQSKLNSSEVVLNDDVTAKGTLDHLKMLKLTTESKVSNEYLVSEKTDPVPNNHEESTENNDCINCQLYSKEIILNHFRRNRLICRFCPRQLSPSKYCKKHELCRLKGSSYRCKFCSEHFEFKSILIAHMRASHSKKIAVERIMKRAVKGMIQNTPVFQNVLKKCSKIR